MENLNPMLPEPECTDVRRILARRGAITVTEYRAVGELKNAGPPIFFSAMVLAIVKGTDRETLFGVKLTVEGSASVAFLDFDELDGLIGALDFMSAFANEPRYQGDSAEVTYSTKEDVRLGCRHHAALQDISAFLTLPFFSHNRSSSYTVELFPRLRELLLAAQRHLTSRGASDV